MVLKRKNVSKWRKRWLIGWLFDFDVFQDNGANLLRSLLKYLKNILINQYSATQIHIAIYTITKQHKNTVQVLCENMQYHYFWYLIESVKGLKNVNVNHVNFSHFQALLELIFQFFSTGNTKNLQSLNNITG